MGFSVPQGRLGTKCHAWDASSLSVRHSTIRSGDEPLLSLKLSMEIQKAPDNRERTGNPTTTDLPRGKELRLATYRPRLPSVVFRRTGMIRLEDDDET